MIKKYFAMILAIVTIFACMVIPADAATYSSGTATRTITVVTGSNWAYPGSESVTISQSKGTFTYNKRTWSGSKALSKNDYGTWDITVVSTDGTHRFSKTMKGSSIKLNLRPNKTYRITVSYDSYQDIFRGLDYSGMRWTRYPSWRVSSTWKVRSCY